MPSIQLLIAVFLRDEDPKTGTVKEKYTSMKKCLTLRNAKRNYFVSYRNIHIVGLLVAELCLVGGIN